MWKWFHQLASPRYFYELSGRLIPWVAWTCALLLLVGLIGGLVLAPPDYQQGDSFRIIYIHELRRRRWNYLKRLANN